MTAKPQKSPLIIAVDGPAGSGKSTICSEVCRRLGWTYVNTGAIYRALGYMVGKRGVSLADRREVAALTRELSETMRWEPSDGRLFVGDEDVSPNLASEMAGRNASRVAQDPELRQTLLEVQRELGRRAPQGAILDGRDIGSVVFPDADLKVFLTASLGTRAKRRYAQLSASPSGPAVTLEEITAEIKKRDHQDVTRPVAPLVQTDDAILLDTSEMSFDAAVDGLHGLIRERLL